MVVEILMEAGMFERDRGMALITVKMNINV